MRKARAEALKPPPILSLSAWAREFGVIPRGTSADSGAFHSYGYQNGLMDAVTDPTIEKITIMKSARVGYTRVLCNVIGYFIHQDPSPMLLIQPTIGDAREFSSDEIEPMLLETPVLKEIVGDIHSRAAKQKMDKRSFRNGASIKFIGAESPNGFRRITVRIVAFDEVDSYPSLGAGDEGDQIALGETRAESYWNSKIILGSTPKIEGSSRIEKSFEASDKRYYNVKCPHCHAPQVLKWENLKWDKSETGEHLFKTAHFRCEAKGCRIEEHNKLSMIDGGEWVATKPFSGHAGFHIWSAYSLHPKAAWWRIAKRWLEVYKDPIQVVPFVNTVLGLPHKLSVANADPDVLKSRVEPYNYETMPDEVRLVTVGADTQDDRIEATFVAHGPHGEMWVARHEVLHGDTSKPVVWDQFDALLAEPIETDEGRKLFVQATCIDSAGHRSEMVYKFCRDRKRRRIYATIGRGNPNPASPRMIWPKTASRSKNSGDKPFIIGVDTAKDDISSRLAIIPNEDGPTPRAIHFPAIGLSGDYFDQLTAEHAVTRQTGTTITRKWETKTPGARNETWDCLVLALAARLSLPIKLEKMPRKPRRNDPVTDETAVDSKVSGESAPVASAAPNATAKDNPPKKRERSQWAAYR